MEGERHNIIINNVTINAIYVFYRVNNNTYDIGIFPRINPTKFHYYFWYKVFQRVGRDKPLVPGFHSKNIKFDGVNYELHVYKVIPTKTTVETIHSSEENGK